MLSLLVTNKRKSHFRKRWATIEMRRELEMSHHTTQFRRRSRLPLRHKVFNNDNERNSVDTTSFGEHQTMMQEIRARLTLAPEIHIHKLSQQQQRIFHINQIIFVTVSKLRTFTRSFDNSRVQRLCFSHFFGCL